MNDDELLTPQQFATRVRWSTKTVYRRLEEGRLPAFHAGKGMAWLIDYRAFRESFRVPTSAAPAASRGNDAIVGVDSKPQQLRLSGPLPKWMQGRPTTL